MLIWDGAKRLGIGNRDCVGIWKGIGDLGMRSGFGIGQQGLELGNRD